MRKNDSASLSPGGGTHLPQKLMGTGQANKQKMKGIKRI